MSDFKTVSLPGELHEWLENLAREVEQETGVPMNVAPVPKAIAFLKNQYLLSKEQVSK